MDGWFDLIGLIIGGSWKVHNWLIWLVSSGTRGQTRHPTVLDDRPGEAKLTCS